MKKFFLAILFIPLILFSQDAKKIVQKANDLMMGKTNVGESTLIIQRPDWTREISMKNWSRGMEYYLILITAPARDKGQVFLKRKKDMWNYIPNINRMIKIPSSMMSQSWMGSDFTNDDLLKESSIVKDYTHTIIGEEKVEGYNCYKIELIPHENAAVVWGKIIMWISQKEFLQLKAEYYDEVGDLINTRLGKDVKVMGGRLIPTTLEMIPADKPGNKTIMKTNSIKFDIPIDDGIFSQQYMKRVR